MSMRKIQTITLRKIAISMFAVGNRLEGRLQRLKGDGSISSIIVSSTLIGAIFSYFWESESPTSWYMRNGYPRTLLVIYCLGFSSIVSLVGLLLVVKYKPSEYLETTPNIKDPVSKMLNVFLFLFGICVVVYELINTIIDIQCYNEVYNLPNSGNYMISTFGRAIEATFAFLQMIVIVQISEKRFRRKTAIYYFISNILLTDVAMWFFTLFRIMYGYVSTLPANLTMTSTTVEMCYWNSSIRSNILQPMNGILIPVQQEYSLICICILINMFPVYYSPRPTATDRDSIQYNDQTMESFSTEVSISADIREGRYKSPKSQMVKRILISLFSILMFLPAGLVLTMRGFQFSVHLETEWECCAIIPILVLICLTFRGFYAIRTEISSINDNRIIGNLLNNDVLFVMSSAGQYACEVLILSYSLYTQGQTYMYLRSLKSVLQIIHVFYQTIFVLILKRLPCNVYKKIHGILLSLLISNLILWCFNEILAFNMSTDGDDAHYVGTDWPTVRQALFSLVCFYRFQAFVCLYRMCRL